MNVKRRSRAVYTVAFAGVIAMGLASRKWPGLFPAVFGKYPGDVLWAIMVFVLVAFVRPGFSSARAAVLALGICYLDEFSQLYQAPWINSIRATTAGHLVLGSTFSWRDMLSYTVGVAIAWAVEALVTVVAKSSWRSSPVR